MPIEFGTDGWRGVISDDFTFENLRYVAQGIAEAFGPGKKVAVGFDTRFLSDRYAMEVACVLAANGINVYLTKADTPTPVLAFSVQNLKADGGVMITASHNPPRYNGVKVKGPHGEPDKALAKKVESIINSNLERKIPPRLMAYEKALAEGLIVRFDPSAPYIEHVKSLVDLPLIAQSNLKVVVDPMYGAGRGYIKNILLEAGLASVLEIRGEMNPGFGGVHPEPIARYLDALVKAVREGWDVGLAHDGDADRIGAVDSEGNFVGPQKIFPLILRYLVEKRGWKGSVVKTVSTTMAVDRLASRYGLPLYETPVGFNYIAEHMLNGDVLMGGEESGGMSVKGHIPEGDGILMGLLLLEAMAASSMPLKALVEDLASDVGPLFYARRDIQLDKPRPKKALVEALLASAPSRIAGIEVIKVSDLDGVKYFLGEEGWLLIRPSGTEPLLRVYAEAPAQSLVEAFLKEGENLGLHALENFPN